MRQLESVDHILSARRRALKRFCATKAPFIREKRKKLLHFWRLLKWHSTLPICSGSRASSTTTARCSALKQRKDPRNPPGASCEKGGLQGASRRENDSTGFLRVPR